MTSPFQPAKVILHAGAAAVMAYGYNALGTLPINVVVETQYGGHFQYLTIQGYVAHFFLSFGDMLTTCRLTVAWLTMVLSLLCDLLPKISGLKQVKRLVFMISLPACLSIRWHHPFLINLQLAIVISTIYWSLITLAPSLILPPDTTATSEPSSSTTAPVLFRIPLSMDLALHASPAITLFLDFVLFEKSYSARETTYGAPAVGMLSTVWYSWWVERCASINGTCKNYSISAYR